jgi:hypothetical protein
LVEDDSLCQETTFRWKALDETGLMVHVDPRVETKLDAFSYITQTWRYVSEEVSLYERMAEAPEGAPEGAGAAA